jgi:hypothetical protein
MASKKSPAGKRGAGSAAPRKQLERAFPQLRDSRFSITSQPDRKYNCIAWAAGETDRWWQPAVGYYWPNGVEMAASIESLVAAYATIGYERCESGDFEDGWEKIAIYRKGFSYSHAARQLKEGIWTSKLGESYDISHELRGLTGEGPNAYGEVAVFLKRRRSIPVDAESVT